MTEASIMLLYSIMNNVPVDIVGMDAQGNVDEEFYGSLTNAHVYSISKVSNIGREEICVTFDNDKDSLYCDPRKIRVSLTAPF